MQVTTIGLDLAKNVFQVHGITQDDEVAFNRPLRRAQLLPFFSRLEPCLIGMEACSSAHHWARELTKFGHDVRLIPPIYVKPYVKWGKSDAIDAEAICEAVTAHRPRKPSSRWNPGRSCTSIQTGPRKWGRPPSKWRNWRHFAPAQPVALFQKAPVAPISTVHCGLWEER